MRFTMMLLFILTCTTAVAQDCIIGNSDAVDAYDTGWIEASARFAQLVDPVSGGCVCSPGFLVGEVHLSLYMDVGASLQVQAHLLDYIDEAGTLSPGPILDSSVPVTFDGASALDLYEIVIPCNFVCALLTESYFLAVEFVGVSGFVEMAYTDVNTGVPMKRAAGGLGSSYTDVGGGWVDMVEAGFPGGLPITATASCCGDPIIEGIDTWGAIKRVYR